MLISAISQNHNLGYQLSSSVPYYKNRNNEPIGDTAFNSLTPFSNKRDFSQEKSEPVFSHINEWQNFCHRQILGNKLNVVI